MGTTTTTSGVYIHVIEDVVNKVREEFINNGGPGESVLNELQGIWEMKMMQAGVLSGPIERSSAQKPTPGGPLTHDLNVPYEGTEEYETPTAEMLFPPTPLQTPLPTPLPGTADNSSMYNIPTGSSDYPTPGSENGGTVDVKGRPSPYMPPPSPWANPRLDVNVAYVDGRDEPERGNTNQQFTQDLFVPSSGKRKRDDSSAQYQNGGSIPQQDGASDAMPQADLRGKAFSITFIGNRKVSRDVICSSSKIPQADGPTPDPYDEMLSTPNIYSEEFQEGSTPAPNEIQTSTPVAIQNDIIEDDEELLNEDDDDDELDDLESGEDMNTQHLVLAQFDKVTRTKSRWKCNLKDGIMHINDKDILFNKVNLCFSTNLSAILKKSETTRSPTRLQRRAPTALHLDHVPENPFLQQSCDTVATTAIPLLSPLFVSPNLHTREGDDFRFPVGFTDKNGSPPSMDHKEGWPYSAKSDNSNQMALLSMFQTKFVLVDQSQ